MIARTWHGAVPAARAEEYRSGIRSRASAPHVRHYEVIAAPGADAAAPGAT